MGQEFKPGFRLSPFDVVILVAGACAAVAVYVVDHRIGLAIGLVVGQFFVFCNVLRLSRLLELIWSTLFAGMAIIASTTSALSWPMVFLLSAVAALLLAVIEVRKPSYHGVGWRRINPELPQWWQERLRRADAGAAAAASPSPPPAPQNPAQE